MKNNYSDEFKKWLIENYSGSSDEVLKKIKEQFNLEITREKLYHIAGGLRKKGYKVENLQINYLFRKGTTWKVLNESKTGTIRKRKKGNFIKLENRKWQEYDKYVYEQTYGKVPRGMCILHINGDIYDDRIENLGMINRYVFNYIIARQLYFDNRKDFETACLVAELAHKKPHYIRPSKRKVVEQNVSN